MQITRIYTGEDGQSHFEDVEMEGHPLLPSLTSITSLRFRVSEPGTFSDWHTESQRNYIITLSGEGEIGIGDGTHRRFGAGAVMLVEDLTGQGHTTRATSDEPRITVAVPLANQVPERKPPRSPAAVSSAPGRLLVRQARVGKRRVRPRYGTPWPPCHGACRPAPKPSGFGTTA